MLMALDSPALCAVPALTIVTRGQPKPLFGAGAPDKIGCAFR